MEKEINNIRIVERENGDVDCIAPDGEVLLENEKREYAELVCASNVNYLPKTSFAELNSEAAAAVEEALNRFNVRHDGVEFQTWEDQKHLSIHLNWGGLEARAFVP